jgi:hypothetical protein
MDGTRRRGESSHCWRAWRAVTAVSPRLQYQAYPLSTARSPAQTARPTMARPRFVYAAWRHRELAVRDVENRRCAVDSKPTLPRPNTSADGQCGVLCQRQYWQSLKAAWSVSSSISGLGSGVEDVLEAFSNALDLFSTHRSISLSARSAARVVSHTAPQAATPIPAPNATLDTARPYQVCAAGHGHPNRLAFRSIESSGEKRLNPLGNQFSSARNSGPSMAGASARRDASNDWREVYAASLGSITGAVISETVCLECGALSSIGSVVSVVADSGAVRLSATALATPSSNAVPLARGRADSRWGCVCTDVAAGERGAGLAYFVSGHLDLSEDEFAAHYAAPMRAAANERASRFVIGNARGADTMALRYLLEGLRVSPHRVSIFVAGRGWLHALRERTLYQRCALAAHPFPGIGIRDACLTLSSNHDIAWVRSPSRSKQLYGAKYRPNRISGTQQNLDRRAELCAALDKAASRSSCSASISISAAAPTSTSSSAAAASSSSASTVTRASASAAACASASTVTRASASAAGCVSASRAGRTSASTKSKGLQKDKLLLCWENVMNVAALKWYRSLSYLVREHETEWELFLEYAQGQEESLASEVCQEDQCCSKVHNYQVKALVHLGLNEPWAFRYYHSVRIAEWSRYTTRQHFEKSIPKSLNTGFRNLHPARHFWSSSVSVGLGYEARLPQLFAQPPNSNSGVKPLDLEVGMPVVVHASTSSGPCRQTEWTPESRSRIGFGKVVLRASAGQGLGSNTRWVYAVELDPDSPLELQGVPRSEHIGLLHPTEKPAISIGDDSNPPLIVGLRHDLTGEHVDAVRFTLPTKRRYIFHDAEERGIFLHTVYDNHACTRDLVLLMCLVRESIRLAHIHNIIFSLEQPSLPQELCSIISRYAV